MTPAAVLSAMSPYAYDIPVSTSASTLQTMWSFVRSHYETPISRTTLLHRFEELADTWKSETAHVSSASDILLSPSYQRIIGLGPDVVPIILESLEREPEHWFWALTMLTGANPVRTEHAGDVRLMTQDWLEWARERRLVA